MTIFNKILAEKFDIFVIVYSNIILVYIQEKSHVKSI